MEKHKKVLAKIDVRFKDIDSMGHVNNAVFLTYFEEGRKAFLRDVLNIVDPGDYPFILAHINCDFLKPVNLGDELAVEIWIGDLGRKSFRFKYHIIDRNDKSIIYAKGESVMVLFDYRKNITIPIPKYFLEKISEYSEQDLKLV
ncbi:MAG TPA: thioesterase family protein [Desulfatiglandales bacterium]|nr:thioesterase family protein [Desulfatiglandales bacterium]